MFIEEYKPKSLDEMFIPKRVIELFEGKEKLEQHYLFYGTQGAGKTTLAWILGKKYGGENIRYLNASTNRGIETVRSIIHDFCKSYGLKAKNDKTTQKVLILDEMDGCTDEFYDALRGEMPMDKEHIRFIGTCNNIQNIPKPIQSRFCNISLDCETADEGKEVKIKYIQYLIKLCKTLDIKYEQDALIQLIRNYWPDKRTIFNILEKLSVKKEIKVGDIYSGMEGEYDKIFEMLMNKQTSVYQIYTFILNTFAPQDYNNICISIGVNFIKYLENVCKLPNDKLIKVVPEICVVVAKYQANIHLRIDALVNCIACVTEIKKILNGI